LCKENAVPQPSGNSKRQGRGADGRLVGADEVKGGADIPTIGGARESNLIMKATEISDENGARGSLRSRIHDQILQLRSRSWAQGQEKVSDIASSDLLARGARTQGKNDLGSRNTACKRVCASEAPLI